MKGKIDIYKASAGSGKTFRLTGEYIKMLFTERDAYKHILAVTFTNKATDQMKQRILSELYLLSTNPDKSPYIEEIMEFTGKDMETVSACSRSVLKRILHDYSAFNISTIDTFFQSVMRAFSRELGRMTSYNVEIDDEEIIAMAVDRLFLSLEKSENKRLLEWLIQYSLEKIDEGHSWRIRDGILSLSKNLNSESFKLKSKAVELSDADSYIGRIQSLKSAITKSESAYRAEIQAIAKKAVGLVKGAGMALEDFKGRSRSPFVKLEPLSENRLLFDTQVYDKFNAIYNKEEEWFKKEELYMADKIYPALNGAIGELLECYESKYREVATAISVRQNLSAIAILGRVYENLVLYCKENNLLLLSETNALLHNIIDGSDTPFIYEKVGTWINHFMIDEFQDTSMMQWENFKPLLQNSMAEGNANLIVGDVKQSIYRWRNSDWRVLNQRVPEELGEFECNINTLSVNWRSSRDLIEFNNSFFGYVAARLEKLYSESGRSGDTTITGIYNYRGAGEREKGGDFADQVPSPDGKKRDGYVEVNLTADINASLLRSVDRLLESGYPENRICILVRTNSEVESVVRSLSEAGYQVSSVEAFKLGASAAVYRVVSLLNELEGDDLPEESAGYAALPLYTLCERLIREKLSEELKEDLLSLQCFLDTVLEFSVKKGDNRTAFLKWWNDSGMETKVQISQESEAINVMTIHKSKGLEFDAVISPFFDLPLEPAGNRSPLLWSNAAAGALGFDGLLAVRYSSKLKDTLFGEEYLNEKLYSYIDNLNLAYVAFTRAKRELMIISLLPDEKKSREGRPNSIAAMLMEYAAERMKRREEDCTGLLYSYGSPTRYCEGEQEPAERGLTLQLSRQFAVPLNEERMKTAFQGGILGDDNNVRNGGIIMHEYFSMIDERGEIEGNVEPEIRELIRKKLATVEKYGWFNGDYTIYKECEIISPSGAVFRPDRVMVRADEAFVIDYKFGEYLPENSKYVRQIRNYMRLLSSMGFSRVQGALWYVTEDKVEIFQMTYSSL